MIADSVGVTKAAVYRQFRTKEAIVVAAVEMELGRLEGALDSAGASGRDRRAVETLLTQVIDLAVGRRRMVSTLQHDPVVVRLLAEHKPFRAVHGALLPCTARGGEPPQGRACELRCFICDWGAVRVPS